MIEGPLLADGNSGYAGNMGEVNFIPTRRTASATRQPQMRPSSDHGYSNHPEEEYLQRPPRPNAFRCESDTRPVNQRRASSGASRRNGSSFVENDDNRICHLRVQKSVWNTDQCRIVPDDDSETKNVVIREHNFTFEGFMEKIFAVFGTPMDQRSKMRLCGPYGDIYVSDSGTERRRHDEEEDESSDSESVRSNRGGASKVTSGGVSSATAPKTNVDSDSGILQRYIANSSYESTYMRDLHGAMRAVLRLKTELAERQSQETNNAAVNENIAEDDNVPELIDNDAEANEIQAEPTVAAILAPFNCFFCTKMVSDPHTCPKCRRVCGGRSCLLKWFIMELKVRRNKRCPLCNEQIFDTLIERNLADFETHLRQLKVPLEYCQAT